MAAHCIEFMFPAEQFSSQPLLPVADRLQESTSSAVPDSTAPSCDGEQSTSQLSAELSVVDDNAETELLCTNSSCNAIIEDDCAVFSASRPHLCYCQRCAFSLLGREVGLTQTSQGSDATCASQLLVSDDSDDDGAVVAAEDDVDAACGGGECDAQRASQKRKRGPR